METHDADHATVIQEKRQLHFPNFLKPVDHGERMTTQLADAKSGRLPSRILTHQLLPNIISLLGRSIMNGWPSIHNRLFQYIRDAYGTLATMPAKVLNFRTI